jgi:hypothetical protein
MTDRAVQPEAPRCEHVFTGTTNRCGTEPRHPVHIYGEWSGPEEYHAFAPARAASQERPQPGDAFDNTTEACRHCPTPDAHPTRIGGILTYEGRCDPETCEKHDHSEPMTDRAVQPRHRYESGPLSGICRACGAKEFSEAHGVAQERPPIDVVRLAKAMALVYVTGHPIHEAVEHWESYRTDATELIAAYGAAEELDD